MFGKKKIRTNEQKKVRAIIALAIIGIMSLIVLIPTPKHAVKTNNNVKVSEVMNDTLDSLLSNKGFENVKIIEIGKIEKVQIKADEALCDSLENTKEFIKTLDLVKNNPEVKELIKKAKRELEELQTRYDSRDSLATRTIYARKIKFFDKEMKKNICFQEYEPEINRKELTYLIVI